MTALDWLRLVVGLVLAAWGVLRLLMLGGDVLMEAGEPDPRGAGWARRPLLLSLLAIVAGTLLLIF